MLSCLIENSLHGGVIVSGIVVKQEQPFRVAIPRNARRFQPRAVTPSLLRWILFRRVLRVVDQEVAVRTIFPQDPVELRVSMFKIAGMSNHSASRFDAKARSSLWMVQGKWVHRSIGQSKHIARQTRKTSFRRQKVKIDWKVRSRHLTFQKRPQSVWRVGRIKLDFVFR